MYLCTTSLQFCKPYTLFVIFIVLLSTSPAKAQSTKPNVIFILADDIGYEVPTVNGGQSYSTPNIDYLAQHGMNFKHCEASPLCSPSRFMLLTGKYNFRNYSIWGWMNKGEKTIGNLMQDAGYKTGWFGKLQQYSHDSDMHKMGFDEYLVFETIDLPNPGLRYKNPFFYATGGVQISGSLTANKYGDDIITERLFDFIDSNQNNPFFAYYPMSLCHPPFSPTPDDTAAFASIDPTLKVSDVTYFPSMVKYMDKKIGEIVARLKASGLDKNTIIIFCSDNGTQKDITSIFEGEEVDGGKHATEEAGTHVPLIAYWPNHITEGLINDDLIDFTDFMPTLADIADGPNSNDYKNLDGKSFYPRLLSEAGAPRDWVFCHFDAKPGFSDTTRRWIQNKTYKLYDQTGTYNSGYFFNIALDRNETTPLPDSVLSLEELATKNYFLSILDTMPKAPLQPELQNPFANTLSDTSAVVGANIVSDGGSPLLMRGSVLQSYPIPAYFPFLRLPDTIATTGTFQQLRTGLLPQTHYSYALFAMNQNGGNNTGFVKIKPGFFTLSSPPLSQPSSFTGASSACMVSLNWSPANFPATGATQGGYLIVYSKGTPALITNPDKTAPKRIVSNGSLMILTPSNLPLQPSLNASIFNLTKDSIYNFLLVPYTWDGVNALTYNYLTEGMLRVSVKVSGLVLTGLIQKESCTGTDNFGIKASVSNGILPYSFSFNRNIFDTVSSFYNLSTGSYVLQAKDSTGCLASVTVKITTPKPLALIKTVNNVSCYGGSDGALKITGSGGVSPYRFSINGGATDTISSFNNLSAASYTATVTDAAGCLISSTVLLPQPKALIPVAVATKTSCITTPDGSISLSASGGTAPYLYSLDGSTYGTNPLFTNLLAKTYSPVVKDALGCTAAKPVTVIAPKALVPVATSTAASCFGVPDGTIKLTVTGGTGPYLYSLDGSTYSTNSLFTNLLGNSYSPVVKDAVGCTAAKPVTVIQPKVLAVTITKVSASCKGAGDGSVTVAAKGGTAPYMYSLNGGAYTAATLFNNLIAGSYTIAVKDANGCEYTVTTTLTQLNKTCIASLAMGTQPSAEAMVAESALKVSVSPNPGLYQFTLTINGKTGAKVLIRVSDVYGKTLHTAEALTNSTYKFGNNLLAGVYFVQVVQGKNVKTLKVIKAK